MKRYLFAAATLGLVVLLFLSAAACTRSVNASPLPSPIEEVSLAGAPAEGAVLAQNGTTVVIAPSVATVEAGATTVVEVQVKDVQNLFGIDVRLSFDPSKLEVQDANPGMAGVQIQAGPFLDVNQGFVAQNSADNTAGRVNYAMTLLGQAQPVSGSGTVMIITFKGIGEGDSAVSFLSALLSDRVGTQIPATTTGGTVSVRSTGGPTVTPVPPTVTPGGPTVTPVPPTVTPIGPTVTPVGPTVTPVPPPPPPPPTVHPSRHPAQPAPTLFSAAIRYPRSPIGSAPRRAPLPRRMASRIPTASTPARS